MVVIRNDRPVGYDGRGGGAGSAGDGAGRAGGRADRPGGDAPAGVSGVSGGGGVRSAAPGSATGRCGSPGSGTGTARVAVRCCSPRPSEPDHALLIRCGNRRSSVCPPCSREYKGDVWHLLHAGTAGGSKGVPEQVATHPMWFVTLTGPGFGAVHGAGCGRGRAGRSASGGRTGRAGDVCAHGRGRTCDRTHPDDDPELGEPVCPDCYDYPAAVAFNWRAPELWRRFTIALRRRLAAAAGHERGRVGSNAAGQLRQGRGVPTPRCRALPRDRPHRRGRRRTTHRHRFRSPMTCSPPRSGQRPATRRSGPA